MGVAPGSIGGPARAHRLGARDGDPGRPAHSERRLRVAGHGLQRRPAGGRTPGVLRRYRTPAGGGLGPGPEPAAPLGAGPCPDRTPGDPPGGSPGPPGARRSTAVFLHRSRHGRPEHESAQGRLLFTPGSSGEVGRRAGAGGYPREGGATHPAPLPWGGPATRSTTGTGPASRRRCATRRQTAPTPWWFRHP